MWELSYSAALLVFICSHVKSASIPEREGAAPASKLYCIRLLGLNPRAISHLSFFTFNIHLLDWRDLIPQTAIESNTQSPNKISETLFEGDIKGVDRTAAGGTKDQVCGRRFG